MKNKVFPPRTPVRESFPDIGDCPLYMGEPPLLGLKELIPQQLALVGIDPEMPQEILLIPPYKPASIKSESNKVIADRITEIAARGNIALRDTPYKLIGTRDVYLLSSRRLESLHSFGWDMPVWAFPTQRLLERPQTCAIILDDSVSRGGTLMALHHACASAGKKVLAAYAEDCVIEWKLHQSSELKKELNALLSADEQVRANSALGRIGLSLETLTGMEVNHLVMHICSSADKVGRIDALVASAEVAYTEPLRSLEFLRTYARDLTAEANKTLEGLTPQSP